VVKEPTEDEKKAAEKAEEDAKAKDS